MRQKVDNFMEEWGWPMIFFVIIALVINWML